MNTGIYEVIFEQRWSYDSTEWHSDSNSVIANSAEQAIDKVKRKRSKDSFTTHEDDEFPGRTYKVTGYRLVGVSKTAQADY